MNKIEKTIFLHIRQYQLGPEDQAEITSTYGQMSPEEKKQYGELSRELHRIWNHINGPDILNATPTNRVKTFQDYHSKVSPISPIILKVLEDFDLTLKDTITQSEKDAIIAILGQGYFDTNMGHLDVIEDLPKT